MGTDDTRGNPLPAVSTGLGLLVQRRLQPRRWVLAGTALYFAALLMISEPFAAYMFLLPIAAAALQVFLPTVLVWLLLALLSSAWAGTCLYYFSTKTVSLVLGNFGNGALGPGEIMVPIAILAGALGSAVMLFLSPPSGAIDVFRRARRRLLRSHH